MTGESSSGCAPRVFPPTHWSVVLAAAKAPSPESAAALETLCQAYWYPLYAYARRCGQSPQDAEDLTQEFFCRLLEKHWLDFVNPERGKLRTFLVAALKNFMAKEWRHASALRRGGGLSQVQLDTVFAERRYAVDASALPPQETFDRQWALTLLDLTVSRLQQEFAAVGKTADFEALKTCLMAEHGEIDYAAVAKRLKVSPGAARVAVHRLRKRFREVYREEISHTLAESDNVEAELRHLAAALAQK